MDTPPALTSSETSRFDSIVPGHSWTCVCVFLFLIAVILKRWRNIRNPIFWRCQIKKPSRCCKLRKQQHIQIATKHSLGFVSCVWAKQHLETSSSLVPRPTQQYLAHVEGNTHDPLVVTDRLAIFCVPPSQTKTIRDCSARHDVVIVMVGLRMSHSFTPCANKENRMKQPTQIWFHPIEEAKTNAYHHQVSTNLDIQGFYHIRNPPPHHQSSSGHSTEEKRIGFSGLTSFFQGNKQLKNNQVRPRLIFLEARSGLMQWEGTLRGKKGP